MTATALSHKWLRVNKQNPCQICGKPDWCLISDDGKAAICARIESDKPAGNKGAGWLHQLDNNIPLPPQRPRTEAKQSPRAMSDVLHTAYESLLSKLTLSAPHRDNLHNRGLTDAEINRLGYKTLPATGRHDVVKNLQSKGIELAGIPGFWLDVNQWQLAGAVGIVIPVRDTNKRIIGLQIRCDQVRDARYKWLSTKNYPEGCSPGAPIHVTGVLSQGEIWITEGALKADIAALKLGRLVLAVAGVGNWVGVIPVLRELKPSRVIIAFDMDKNINHAVRLHTEALIMCLLKGGIRTFEADWNQEAKGIDDFLTRGTSCQLST